jgi:hypothetical protein
MSAVLPSVVGISGGESGLDICCKICTKSKNFKGQEATERERALSDDRRAEIRINILLGNLEEEWSSKPR